LQVISAFNIQVFTSLSLNSNFSQIAISPADATAVATTLTSQSLLYFIITPTTIALNQNITVTNDSSPSSVAYLNETSVLVVQTMGGFYLYIINSAGLTYTYQVYSANSIVGFTMLQSNALSPAANGLFLNSSDNNIYSFIYVRGMITVTSVVTNFGNKSLQSIFTN
jgi:hypothetical protein